MTAPITRGPGSGSATVTLAEARRLENVTLVPEGEEPAQNVMEAIQASLLMTEEDREQLQLCNAQLAQEDDPSQRAYIFFHVYANAIAPRSATVVSAEEEEELLRLDELVREELAALLPDRDLDQWLSDRLEQLQTVRQIALAERLGEKQRKVLRKKDTEVQRWMQWNLDAIKQAAGDTIRERRRLKEQAEARAGAASTEIARAVTDAEATWNRAASVAVDVNVQQEKTAGLAAEAANTVKPRSIWNGLERFFR